MNTTINTMNATTSTATVTRSTKAKAVMCMEDNQIFNSIKEASQYYGLNQSNICGVLAGVRKHTGGHTFRYVDNNGTPVEINQPDVVIKVNNEPKPIELKRHVTLQKEATIEANGTRDNGNCKSVMCITDGKSFASMTDAAEHYGIATSQISYACSEKGRTAAGKQFCKFSDLYLYIPEISKAINDQTAYDILLEKENARKAMKANIVQLEEEAYAIELKMNEVKQALEQAKMELANFD